jgi:hypothetical protein
MLRGLTTVSFYAEDVTAAMDWYSQLLGIEAYFVRPELHLTVPLHHRVAPSPTGMSTTYRARWRSYSSWAPRSTNPSLSEVRGS